MDDIVWDTNVLRTYWDQTQFFTQHFLGKKLVHDPHAPAHHLVFDDGTAVYATNVDRSSVYEMQPNFVEHLAISDAYIEGTGNGDGNCTHSLYIKYVGDPHPHLLCQASFTYEAFGDAFGLALVALDEDDR